MKKTIATLMGATLLASSMSVFAATPVLISANPELINEEVEMPEIDLPMYHWATEAAEAMAELGLVENRLTKDYDEVMAKDEFASAIASIFALTDTEIQNHFAEDGETTTLTRLQVATILEQLFEAKEIQVRSTMMNPVFVDIEEDFHGFGAISFVVNTGIMNGDHEGNFNPDAELTFAEGVTILSRVADLVLGEDEITPVHLPVGDLENEVEVETEEEVDAE